MKVIHVLRKPLSEGTVAKNVLKHGTGGLNIDASRISTSDNLNGGAYAKNPTERWDGDKSWRFKRGMGRGKLPRDTREGAAAGMYQEGSRASGEFIQPEGRWPANVILQHKPGCRCLGTQHVKSDGHYPTARPSGSQVSGPSGHSGQDGLQEMHTSGEAVSVWACEPECPVAALDEQSGTRPSTGPHPSAATVESIYRPDQGAYQAQGPLYDDVGGASRFFKQVGGNDGSGS